jgi:competence ComEA-like helix-hairpin-helix protein
VPIPGFRESSGGKRRALLILSTILLVWNAVATARHVVSIGPPVPAAMVAGSGILPAIRGNESPELSAENPRSGPPTIRQKFLLGKRIDINNANLSEIAELPGISDKVAAAVVEERKRLGGFRSPEDLLGAKGIKRKRLQKILPFLVKMPNN